jgi:OmcA/MtrC family decaheme c-type cytochrome
MHAKGLPANLGTRTATITSVTFNPDNAVVIFTFTATPSGGVPVADNILLTPSGSDLAYAKFTIARLVPGQVYPVPPNRDPDLWFFYGPRSHTKSNQLEGIAPNIYRFTFVDNTVLDPAWAGYTHRVGIEIYGLGVQSVNPTFDFVPNQGAGPYTFAQTRDIVTTAACNECHNPLGYTPSPGFHGSRRVETKFCGLCHNPNNALAPQSGDPGAPFVPIPFAKLVHGIHTAQNLLIFEGSENVGDFTDVTYPILIEPLINAKLGIRDVRNCTKCHKGGADSDNWKTRPSIEACGSCHVKINFATGAGHVGGAQADNRLCATCHVPEGAINAIQDVHRTENVTPNNSTILAGLDRLEYNITSVTVDTDNVTPVVKFWIKKNGAFLDLLIPPDNTIKYPTGYSTASRPSFVVAWALPQDGISEPTDYNNRNSPQAPSSSTGNGAGQPPTVNIVGLPATGTPAEYTVKLTTAKYPAGAQMRAVGLQGYFTQLPGIDLNNDGVVNALDNVARHTPSVVKGVTGDRTRRVVVKTGYTDNANPGTAQPVGCMECHEILEMHGGSRVNNVQICVMCHNPNLSSSGRTADPTSTTTPIPPETVAALGPDPLKYPEATNMFRSLIHGIHAAPIRDNPFEFVRNRSNGLYYNWSTVRFPGNLRDCTKCHDGPTYNPSNLPAGLLWVTEKITTGDPAETRADIIAARTSIGTATGPNATGNLTDLVTSPITSACYYCHDSSAHADHFRLNGADILSTREDALLAAP